MWYMWITLLLVSCALVAAEVEVAAEARPVATTRAPLRTLDRKAAELAWHSWLQSPESGSQNATHRRITTKSLFITPLVCPKGQRLDRNGCVEVVIVDPKEHERNLLNQLSALFTSAPNNGDVVYDYGDEEQGPFQLNIPIGLDPQAPSAQELTAQAQSFVKFDKKEEKKPNTDASIEAELEILKLQQTHDRYNNTSVQGNILSHNVLNNILSYSDKPKRNSPLMNDTSTESDNSTEKGEEELVFGQVNVDPITYDMESQDTKDDLTSTIEKKHSNETVSTINEEKPSIVDNDNMKIIDANTENDTATDSVPNSTMPPPLKPVAEQMKLNPEHEYSDIGEAIKLISRYADVSTDDIFTKDERKDVTTEDSILGTRTKLQYRRNKPKVSVNIEESPDKENLDIKTKETPENTMRLNSDDLYRYPGANEDSVTPPPHYPFRHLQDYWPGRNYAGGVYNTHENPRRHHHSYPHYFRPRSYPHLDTVPLSPDLREPYSGFRRYTHRLANHNTNPVSSHPNNQDLYSLLGLRHWFGSEGASKR